MLLSFTDSCNFGAREAIDTFVLYYATKAFDKWASYSPNMRLYHLKVTFKIDSLLWGETTTTRAIFVVKSSRAWYAEPFSVNVKLKILQQFDCERHLIYMTLVHRLQERFPALHSCQTGKRRGSPSLKV